MRMRKALAKELQKILATANPEKDRRRLARMDKQFAANPWPRLIFDIHWAWAKVLTDQFICFMDYMGIRHHPKNRVLYLMLMHVQDVWRQILKTNNVTIVSRVDEN